MDLARAQNILDGSRAWEVCRRITLGSRVLAAGRTVSRTVSRAISSVLDGSRTVRFVRRKIWPLLLVEDYLDSGGSVEFTTLDNSVVWVRLRRCLIAAWGRVSALGRLVGVRGSRLLAPGISSDRREARRRAMAVLVVFLALFYAARAVLVTIVPAAAHYVGWASGLVIGLLLAAIIIQASGR